MYQIKLNLFETCNVNKSDSAFTPCCLNYNMHDVKETNQDIGVPAELGRGKGDHNKFNWIKERIFNDLSFFGIHTF